MIHAGVASSVGKSCMQKYLENGLFPQLQLNFFTCYYSQALMTLRNVCKAWNACKWIFQIVYNLQ